MGNNLSTAPLPYTLNKIQVQHSQLAESINVKPVTRAKCFTFLVNSGTVCPKQMAAISVSLTPMS